MKVIDNLPEWLEARRELHCSIGFVPTMGALHDGHASLLRESVAANEVTVLSIYVNPTQFNDPEDLANYPDTLTADLDLAREIGVDYVILPTYDEIYADGYRFSVDENLFSLELCGANRPGHFTGVLTVVMKLLNIVRPTRAYFGRKDYQQYVLIRDMVKAFFVDVEIVGCETIRECDGLALSSRNKLLDQEGRRLATRFNRALRLDVPDAEVRDRLSALGFQVDYVETRGSRRFGAVVVSCRSDGADGGSEHTVRLIDNVGLREAAEVA